MAAENVDHATQRSRRLFGLIGEYYTELASGVAPDRQALLDLHPDLADSLWRAFIEHDRFDYATRSLAGASVLTSTKREQGAAIVPDGDLTLSRPHALDGAAAHGDSRRPHDHAVKCLGDYELLGELARGGMGIVYRARQRSLNRTVALKMILAGRHASMDERTRFHNEAQAAANLDHPHIVPVYEVGEHEGCSYLAMKLIEGPSLARVIGDANRKAGERETSRGDARVIAVVARAVHHAHERGVLHRDLKPSNILLDEQGQPYVTDFGLAKRVGGDVELTQTGAILGSPPYMAPEQASGTKGTVTTATDVYGLGAVLYAMLTGRPPFLADSVLETIDKVKACEPEPPSATNAAVDRDLQTICLKCLEKDPRAVMPPLGSLQTTWNDGLAASRLPRVPSRAPSAVALVPP